MKISFRPQKKMRTFFSFKCQKFMWRSANFWLPIFSKLFLDSQSKYHVQSDLSYNLKQARIAYSLQFSSYTGGHCISSIKCAILLCCCCAISPILEQDQFLIRIFNFCPYGQLRDLCLKQKYFLHNWAAKFQV